jgi:hypothetical protein
VIPCRSRPGRSVVAGPVLVLVAGLPLLGAGCAGSAKVPAVASLATMSTPAPSTSSPASSGAGLTFAACMRSHGVTSFPDAAPGKGFDLSGIDHNAPRFQSAQKSCESLLPTHTPAQLRQHIAQELAEAVCMRAHGVSYFPDPNGEGEIIAQPGSGWDPSSPQFQKAAKICAHFNPGTG